MSLFIRQSDLKLPPQPTAEEAFWWLNSILTSIVYLDEQERRSVSRLLVSSITEIPSNQWLLCRSSYKLNPPQCERLLHDTQCLLAGMPIQYVLGEVLFGPLTLNVAPGVLIPRPETEELCYMVVNEWKSTNPTILDLGAGSGAIALYLNNFLRDSQCYALEKSPEAITILHQNILKVDPNEEQIHIIKGDMTVPKAFIDKIPPLDILISNPPYVLDEEKEEMSPHVLYHEPPMALFAPKRDPLYYYKAIDRLITFLTFNPNAKIYLELNARLAEETLNVFKDSSFLYNMDLKKDLSGKYRFFVADIIAS